MAPLRILARSLMLITVFLGVQASLAPGVVHPGMPGILDRAAPPAPQFVAPTAAPNARIDPLSGSSALNQSTYLPMAYRITGVPLFEISAWTENGNGSKSYAFLGEQPIRFRVQIKNNTNQIASITYRWIQRGPCDTVILFTEPFEMGSDPVERTYPATTENCYGVYVNQIQITYQDQLFNTFFNYIVAPPSSIVIGDNQGFDRCDLPSLDAMATWWENSPYYTYNLYLGGISLGCSIARLNPTWVYSAARQGWDFILTWVGPQAPCTRFKYRMHPDTENAYQEGRSEADKAASAAARLGFMGERVIYYDIESYSGASQECREAVASFVRGWVERLHALGYHAGAYGAPCSSFISDWAEVLPPPDDVWIAHWYADGYDPDATVWDAPCLSNSLWADRQRIKQYVGGHDETWGGVTLRIDSDVLDGEVVSLPGVAENLAPFTSSLQSSPTSLIYAQPRLRAMGMVAPHTGWAIRSDRLLWSKDGGLTWQDITPTLIRNPGDANYRLLTARFLDTRSGMAILERTLDGAIFVYLIDDLNQPGESVALPGFDSALDILAQGAYLHFVDQKNAFVVIRLQSGSAFSLGRLFATEDGGHTWQERALPGGEAVVFLDHQTGWTTGRSSSGMLLYRSTDGGRSWKVQSLPVSSPEMDAGLPVFFDAENGLLPVVLTSQNESRLLILQTDDQGNTWRVIRANSLPESMTGGKALSLEAVSALHWWINSSGKLLEGGEEGGFRESNLPADVIDLDFSNEKQGWALVQEGFCQGEKVPLGSTGSRGTVPLICLQTARLMGTVDGGKNWLDISPVPEMTEPATP